MIATTVITHAEQEFSAARHRLPLQLQPLRRCIELAGVVADLADEALGFFPGDTVLRCEAFDVEILAVGVCVGHVVLLLCDLERVKPGLVALHGITMPVSEKEPE